MSYFHLNTEEFCASKISFYVLFSDLEMMIPRLPNSTFSFRLKELYIHFYSVKKLLPYCMLSCLQNLEKIEVSLCEELEEIISVEEEHFCTLPLSLPNLRRLFLTGLPKLKSVCSKQMKCNYLKIVWICYCKELKDVSISLPLPCLRSVKASPRKWWKLVKWGQLDQKGALPCDAYDWLSDSKDSGQVGEE